jgi:RNA polymerase sigma factor (sigma-70 family)
MVRSGSLFVDAKLALPKPLSWPQVSRAGTGLAPPRGRAASGRGGSKIQPTSAYQIGLEFLERCLAGDPGSRSEFVERYGALIRFAMSSVLRQRGIRLPPEDVDDLFQGIVLSFFERDCRRLKLYEGRNDASFATFVRVCATRQTLDRLRQLRRRAAVTVDAESLPERGGIAELPDEASGPEARTLATQQVAQLRDVVLALPPREQLLIRLHLVDGHSISEVARVLGISDNATHVLKSRVRTKLRHQLELERDG